MKNIKAVIGIILVFLLGAACGTKISAIEADLAVHRAHVAQEIRSILTPEQLAKAKELQAQREKRMDERATRPGKRQNKGM